MTTLKKIAKGYDKTEEIILATLLAASIIIIFIQVIMRYVFNNSLTWSEEIARFIFIWITWLGISLGEKKGQHIAVTIVTDRLKGKVRKIVLLIGELITLAIIGALVYYGIYVTNGMVAAGTVSSATGLPMWIVYVSMPIGCGLMGIRVVYGIYCLLTDKREEQA